MVENVCLRDKIAQAQELGTLYKESNKIKHIKSDMDNMAPQLSTAMGSLNNAANLHRALRSLSINANHDASEIRERLVCIQKGLAKGEFKYADAQVLVSNAKQIEKALNDDWKHYISSRIADAKSIVLSVKDMVDDDPKYKAMNSAETRIYQSAPGSSEALKAIDDYLASYKDLMRELNLSSDVFSFITKLTSKQSVCLDELDEKCLQALKASSFAKKMKIVISRN